MKSKEPSISQLMMHMLFASLITVSFGNASNTEEKIVSAPPVYAIYHGDDKPLKFQETLTHIVFTVKLKLYFQRDDYSAKGDWGVGITIIDVMEAAKNVDTVTLLSGDSDFDMLLKKDQKGL